MSENWLKKWEIWQFMFREDCKCTNCDIFPLFSAINTHFSINRSTLPYSPVTAALSRRGLQLAAPSSGTLALATLPGPLTSHCTQHSDASQFPSPWLPTVAGSAVEVLAPFGPLLRRNTRDHCHQAKADMFRTKTSPIQKFWMCYKTYETPFKGKQ